MNELFVNIKVDREERPDIDQIYMTALHALGEQGGWPLTMFLTPDGEPFWGGTYFPKDGALRPARLSSTCCARSRGCSARSREKHRAASARALMAHLARDARASHGTVHARRGRARRRWPTASAA